MRGYKRRNVFKAEWYVKTLHAMGLVEWETMSDVLADDMLNMDEVAADTTKHRRKLVADASAGTMRLFQITPKGDGKMNMHLTACITSCANGQYQDKQNNIEGAVNPLLVHTDKAQTKDKQKEERERQRMGKAPSEHRVDDRFKRGLTNPDIILCTTRNGSMTQETMVVYAKHLVVSLPHKDKRNPQMLFLDGYTSRWLEHALLHLVENRIFPFFFASLSSVWCHPTIVAPTCGGITALSKQLGG
jgi:hypothetical protein